MTSGFRRRQGALLIGVLLFGALNACGSGDPDDAPSSQVPVGVQSQPATTDQQGSAALSLQAPQPAEVPVLSFIPPATTEAPPPRAHIAVDSKIELAPELGLGLATPSVLRQVVQVGLAAPTDLAAAISGSLFYTDRLQGLFVLRPGTPSRPVPLPGSIGAGVALEMLAVAVDPEFMRNRFVYVFARTKAAGSDIRRVVRLALDDSNEKVVDHREILTVTAGEASCGTNSGSQQAGGGLRFGPDGFLYVGLGDGCVADAPQSPRHLAGRY